LENEGASAAQVENNGINTVPATQVAPGLRC